MRRGIKLVRIVSTLSYIDVGTHLARFTALYQCALERDISLFDVSHARLLRVPP